MDSNSSRAYSLTFKCVLIKGASVNTTSTFPRCSRFFNTSTQQLFGVNLTVPGTGSPSGRCDEASLSARLCWPPSWRRRRQLGRRRRARLGRRRLGRCPRLERGLARLRRRRRKRLQRRQLGRRARLGRRRRARLVQRRLSGALSLAGSGGRRLWRRARFARRRRALMGAPFCVPAAGNVSPLIEAMRLSLRL